VAELADRFTDAGLAEHIISRRAPVDLMMALAAGGVCTSVAKGPGDTEWRLRLSGAGQAVRRVLVARAAAKRLPKRRLAKLSEPP
jgi:hypothetical protein